MNFYIYRELTHDNPGGSTWELLGSTKYREDAMAILDRWHSGYIITSIGEITFQKNLSKKL